MRLVLVGPPGAGKGTQAKFLEERLDLVHISTGDIFRANIKNKTALGQEVEAYLAKGQLVPDSLTIRMVWDRLDQVEKEVVSGEKRGWLLDGFPRTLDQADALKEGLAERGLALDAVVLLAIEDAILVHRLVGRRTCPQCGASYHVEDQPPKVEGICDVCGHSLIQREDDQEATIRQRIDVYHGQTKPLLSYYEKEGILLRVDADQSVEAVSSAISLALQA